MRDYYSDAIGRVVAYKTVRAEIDRLLATEAEVCPNCGGTKRVCLCHTLVNEEATDAEAKPSGPNPVSDSELEELGMTREELENDD